MQLAVLGVYLSEDQVMQRAFLLKVSLPIPKLDNEPVDCVDHHHSYA